jgi:putative ABC transport system ATP-binding protein
MVDVRGLTKVIDTPRHRVEILRGVDLHVPKGQFLAILGASGSGKSTLLGLIAGLDAPTSGQVFLDGQEITRLSEDRLAQVRGVTVGFVFQSYQLIPTLTAEENVLLPFELVRLNGFDGRRRARELLDSVGLADRRDHYPVQLSGGEQQRVALARAFMLRPPILLADEPTGNLDSSNGRHVLELLLAMRSEQGTTLILVTHDQQLAGRADRHIVLEDGRIVSDDRRD